MIPPLYRWLAIAVAVVVGALALVAWDAARIKRAEGRGYTRAQVEYQAAAERQREDNRGRARGAEQKHAGQQAVREEFIGYTIKEVVHVAAPLSACPVPADLRRLLHDAAICAREDRPASCGAGDPVPVAR